MAPPESLRPTRLPSNNDDTLDRALLSGLHMLRGVCLDSVWALLACCRVCTLEVGQHLLQAGMPNRTMYMILSGRLSVHLETPPSEAVAVLDAGETVGELSVIDDSRATAHVVAAEPSRLLAVDEETFWRLIAASHEFACNLLVLLAQRMRANNATLSASEKMRRQLERDATVDGLTGLYNRRWLEDRLPRLVQRFLRNGESLSVVMIDIDHFKRFNDQFGHLAGDVVLAAVARRIQLSVRPTDLTARYGGEEMLVVLPDTGADGARCAAERLREQVSRMSLASPDNVPLPCVSISAGVADLRQEDTVGSLVGRADAALYRAKAAGRNRVEV